MELSITTDYATDTGDPSPFLGRIAEAGFSHIHWCHHWSSDFLYSRREIDQIRDWLTEYGLRLLDLHGSVGPEKNWASAREYERRSGVELVRNRLDMAARLGGDAIVMHTPSGPPSDPLRRSLDELEGYARSRNVRIALENGDFVTIRQLLSDYGCEYLGLCYDAGHGNVERNGLDQLDTLKDRLISIHLHDNDGTGDQHNLLFSGTVDWPRLAGIIEQSAYKKCISMEVIKRDSGIDDEVRFLSRALETGREFTDMVGRGPSSHDQKGQEQDE